MIEISNADYRSKDKHFLYFTLGIVVLLMMLLVVCAKRGERRDLVNFNMTIFITQPLKSARGNSLPTEIIKLNYPLTHQDCPKTAYVPKVKLIRIGMKGSEKISLTSKNDDSGGLDVFVKFFNAQNLDLDRRKIKKRLSKLALDDKYFNNKSYLTDADESLSRELNKIQNSRIFVYKPGRNLSVYTFYSKDYSIVTDVDTLSYSISAELCNNDPTGSQYEYIVLYNPGKITSGNNNHLASDVDIEYTKFIDWKRKVTRKPGEILAQIKKLEADYADDYRFTLERAILSIFGYDDHHEAFYHLTKAAEKALRKAGHNPAEMLSRLRQDEDSTFKRLAQGHEEWKDIKEALEHRDLEEIHHIYELISGGHK